MIPNYELDSFFPSFLARHFLLLCRALCLKNPPPSLGGHGIKPPLSPSQLLSTTTTVYSHGASNHAGMNSSSVIVHFLPAKKYIQEARRSTRFCRK